MTITQLLVPAVIGGLYFAYRNRATLPKIDGGLVVAIALIVGYLGYVNREHLGFVEPVAPVVAADTDKDRVALIAAKISGDDAKEFGNYALGLADLIESDPTGQFAKTVDDLVKINSRAGTATLKKRLQNADGSSKYPGFGKAVDDNLIEVAGGRDTFLSNEQRAALVKFLRALHAKLK